MRSLAQTLILLCLVAALLTPQARAEEPDRDDAAEPAEPEEASEPAEAPRDEAEADDSAGDLPQPEEDEASSPDGEGEAGPQPAEGQPEPEPKPEVDLEPEEHSEEQPLELEADPPPAPASFSATPEPPRPFALPSWIWRAPAESTATLVQAPCDRTCPPGHTAEGPAVFFLPDLHRAEQPGLFTPPDTSGDAATGEASPALPTPTEDAGLPTWDAIKAILGLLILLALAYIGGHPIVRRFERKLRISQMVTAGFPFVIFGVIASSESVGVLTPAVIQTISPLLPLGLGWIGFAVGIRFTLRRPSAQAAHITQAFVLTTFVPFAMIVGAASLMLAVAGGGIDSKAEFLRDAMLLATAGAMTARGLPSLVAARGADERAVQRMRHIIQLEEMFAFAALIVIAAFFRPDEADVGWHLPSVGWVFITIGIGSALGAVTFAALGAIDNETETLVVMLGAIAFAAGISSYLRLSPLVVCFLAAVLLSNLPGKWKGQVRRAIARLERPIYLIFLLIAGALWPVDDWRGWALMGLFVAARFGGRLLSVRLLAQRRGAFTPLEQRTLAASPMGALSIAIIMTAQDLYSGTSLSWIVSAVLGGAIVTEFVTQLSAFATQRLFPDYRGEDAAAPDAQPLLSSGPPELALTVSLGDDGDGPDGDDDGDDDPDDEADSDVEVEETAR